MSNSKLSYFRGSLQWNNNGRIGYGPYVNKKLKDILAPNNSNIVRTNSIGMAYPIEGTLNGGSLNTYLNYVCPNQSNTIVITNTPWANQYTFSVISGSNVYLFQSGNICDFYTTSSGSFTIRVTVKNPKNCTKTRDLYFNSSCSQYSAFLTPNPAGEVLNVYSSLLESSEHTDSRLINLAGKEYSPISLSNANGMLALDVSDVPEGFYVLEVRIGGRLLRERVIIER